MARRWARGPSLPSAWDGLWVGALYGTLVFLGESAGHCLCRRGRGLESSFTVEYLTLPWFPSPASLHIPRPTPSLSLLQLQSRIRVGKTRETNRTWIASKNCRTGLGGGGSELTASRGRPCRAHLGSRETVIQLDDTVAVALAFADGEGRRCAREPGGDDPGAAKRGPWVAAASS